MNSRIDCRCSNLFDFKGGATDCINGSLVEVNSAEIASNASANNTMELTQAPHLKGRVVCLSGVPTVPLIRHPNVAHKRLRKIQFAMRLYRLNRNLTNFFVSQIIDSRTYTIPLGQHPWSNRLFALYSCRNLLQTISTLQKMMPFNCVLIGRAQKKLGL